MEARHVIFAGSLLIALAPAPVAVPVPAQGTQAPVSVDHSQVRANAVRVNAVRANPGQADPDRANPARANPDRAHPGALPATPFLRPTAHPPLPKSLDNLWLVPAAAPTAAVSAALKQFAAGLESIAADDYAAALPKVSDPRLARTPVADYAAYYTALAQLHTGRLDAARKGFNAINARKLPGVLREWALVGEAEAAETQGQFADAARLYEMASMLKVAAPDQVLSGLARTLAAAGDRPRALTAYRRVYYEFPLSELSEAARSQVLQLAGQDESTRLRQDFALELGRAQRLFGAKRYAEALTSFEALRDLADDDNRELVGVRIAEAQFYLGRYKQAIEAARPFVGRASRKAEARFFALSAQRGGGDHAGYVDEARKLVQEFPTSPWAEETLNNLGTHYILVDDDDTAVDVFREYLERFPTGRHAQRAAWKLGWARYRQQRYQEAIAAFEQAAAAFPRSDYRPPYLYWSARAYDQLGQKEAAAARYALISVDYLHSYYGRLADVELRKRKIVGATQRRALAETPPAGAPSPAAAAVARAAVPTPPVGAPPDGGSVSAGTAAAGVGATDVGASDVSPGGASATATAPPPATSGTTEGAAKTAPGVTSTGTTAASVDRAAATTAIAVPPTAAGAAGSTSSIAPPATSAAAARAQGAALPVPIPREIETRVRQLIAAGLYAPAIAEVDCARRQWDTSPVLEATLAWLYRAQGDLRRGINTMKRAYPQYLTADGHVLPKDVQKVIFPIDYWPLIRRHAVARGLDPYLIAALVAQESTFVADIRSVANAYGLMQVLPSTGRQLSRALGIRRFTTARLTDPEINIRLGTLYFQRLVKQFGGTHYALASYNAGENRVERWIAERPPMPQDEFIDDIPFPETQNYVKRILGTAEDYRRLYGE